MGDSKSLYCPPHAHNKRWSSTVESHPKLSQTSHLSQHCFFLLYPYSDLLGGYSQCPQPNKSCFLENELESAGYPKMTHPKMTMDLVNVIKMPSLIPESRYSWVQLLDTSIIVNKGFPVFAYLTLEMLVGIENNACFSEVRQTKCIFLIHLEQCFFFFIDFYWSIVALWCCVSAIQQRKSVTCIHISPVFTIYYPFRYHGTMSRVPCAMQ